MKELKLLRGEIALIDDEDYERVTQFHSSWRMLVKYVACTIGGKTFYLHKFIMRSGSQTQVDHINGDLLDNRKENLRLCNNAQNCRNQGVRTDSKTGYKGVTRHSKLNKAVANIRVDGKLIYLGLFDTNKEAAIAYNHAAKQYFGEFAWLNDV